VRVLLLHEDRDFQPKPELADEVFEAMSSGSVTEMDRVKHEYARRHPGAEPPLPDLEAMRVQDLELATVWNTMSGGDEFVYEMARRVVLSSSIDVGVIRYRQSVLTDCLRNPEIIRRIYDLSVEALRNIRRAGALRPGAGPGYVLRRSVALLKQHLETLRGLRLLAVTHAGAFGSPGLVRFITMLQDELAESYLVQLDRTLDELQFTHGMVVSAGLNSGDETGGYLIHGAPPETEAGWMVRFTGGRRNSTPFTIEIDPSDEDGAQELEWLRDNAIQPIADVAAQAADHIQGFFTTLRLELAFYLGAVNLYEALQLKGVEVSFPEPLPPAALALAAQDLRDVSLILRAGHEVIGNDVAADGRSLIVITGANHGGKSTTLRSLGVAQLLMQCGMFVVARRYRASVCAGIYTHYRRQEDTTLESGKLGEELGRMQRIAGAIAPHSMLLCNESFAATNEREGSEIARQVVTAMLAKQIRVVFVTHMYEFAHGFYAQQLESALFLRAEREPDGRRTYQLLELEPLPTSYGQDSYRRIFSP
jgi:hypothetical protein